MASDTIDPSVMSVEQLVTGVIANDGTAIAEIFRRYRRGMGWIARQRGLSAHDAEDVVQDALLDAILQIQSGDINQPQALAGYLRMICLRKALNFREKSRRVDSYDANPVIATNIRLKDEHGDTERRAIINERAAIVRKALEQLRPDERELLTRFYLHEQPEAQIRREMKLTENQFRLNKSRAKQKFGDAGKQLLASTPKRRMGIPAEMSA